LAKQGLTGNPFLPNPALAANLWQDMLNNQPQEMQQMESPQQQPQIQPEGI
jgi:hypothetical protein